LIGEFGPLTHLGIVRAIILKVSTSPKLQYDAMALTGLMLLMRLLAATRFRRAPD
jgi:hypothetical protein